MLLASLFVERGNAYFTHTLDKTFGISSIKTSNLDEVGFRLAQSTGINPFGGGRSGKRIVEILQKFSWC